jgi:penicillin-binding protein 2
VREVAPRGVIEDSKGRVLVTNGAQFTVFLIPGDLPKLPDEKQSVLDRLAGILSLSPEDLLTVMKRNDPGASNPIPVAEGVSQHVVARIAENHMILPGILTSVEPVRQYPYGQLAAHLIGYIGQISDKELSRPENDDAGYKPGDFIGKTGIERQYDNLLNGTPGGRWYEVDARGRRRREMGEDPVVAGATLGLGLDREVQAACEGALAGRKGAAVAVDPRDGRVLALASYPAYDPSMFARRPLAPALYKRLSDEGAFFNRALLSANPPGSTFKIITSAAGLNSGKVDAYTTEFCAGGIMLGHHLKRCDGVHGTVDLTQAIEASCDTFFYRIGLSMGPDAMANMAGNFGLGQKTGIDMPWETVGTVPSPAWKRTMAPRYGNPDSTWYPGDTANMAIGQGGVQATPIQMAMVAAAIGNGGSLYEPRIVVKATSSSDGSVLYAMKPMISHHLPLTPAQIAEIAKGMRQVVIGPRGTSHAADLEGVAVAGKSGSAEVRGGGPTHAWFVCFAPYENPTIAICVFLESGGHRLHGGVDAAPIARHMIATYFHVPDKLAHNRGGRVAD